MARKRSGSNSGLLRNLPADILMTITFVTSFDNWHWLNLEKRSMFYLSKGSYGSVELSSCNFSGCFIDFLPKNTFQLTKKGYSTLLLHYTKTYLKNFSFVCVLYSSSSFSKLLLTECLLNCSVCLSLPSLMQEALPTSLPRKLLIYSQSSSSLLFLSAQLLLIFYISEVNV